MKTINFFFFFFMLAVSSFAQTHISLKSSLNDPDIFVVSDYAGKAKLAAMEKSFDQLGFQQNDASPELISIKSLLNNLDKYKSENLSHLCIYYALASSNSNRMFFIAGAVNLFESENLLLPPTKYSKHEFTSQVLNTATNKKAFFKTQKDFFANKITNLVPGGMGFVNGYYLDFVGLNTLANDFKNEGFTHIEVKYGLLKGFNANDWNCIHLMLRGVSPAKKTVSDKVYTTFDFNRTLYAANARSCPPFRCME
jgi:hypothetical protein